jgi:hypothetical protein
VKFSGRELLDANVSSTLVAFFVREALSQSWAIRFGIRLARLGGQSGRGQRTTLGNSPSVLDFHQSSKPRVFNRAAELSIHRGPGLYMGIQGDQGRKSSQPSAQTSGIRTAIGRKSRLMCTLRILAAVKAWYCCLMWRRVPVSTALLTHIHSCLTAGLWSELVE